MIIQKNTLEKLKEFGINSYEAKLWVALLSRGTSTAGELSDISNVPRSRTYDVLESLEKKGFIIMKIGKPIKYLAVDPKEVVKRVQKNIKKNAENRVEQIESIKDSDVLNELSLLHNQGIDTVEPSEYTGSMKGRDSIYNQLEEMFKSAEESITIVTTEEGFKRKISYFDDILKKANKRGIDIRIATNKVDEEMLDEIDFAEIREIKNINSRFIIVDKKEILFMLMNDNEVHSSYDTGIWINSPFFSSAIEDLLEIAWKEMKLLKKMA
ncbi:MAG: TrmB family transcriptional regulator [Nanobdellota archaeon]